MSRESQKHPSSEGSLLQNDGSEWWILMRLSSQTSATSRCRPSLVTLVIQSIRSSWSDLASSVRLRIASGLRVECSRRPNSSRPAAMQLIRAKKLCAARSSVWRTIVRPVSSLEVIWPRIDSIWHSMVMSQGMTWGSVFTFLKSEGLEDCSEFYGVFTAAFATTWFAAAVVSELFSILPIAFIVLIWSNKI